MVCLLTSFASKVYLLCDQKIKLFLFLLDEEEIDVEEGMCVKFVSWIHVLILLPNKENSEHLKHFMTTAKSRASEQATEPQTN